MQQHNYSEALHNIIKHAEANESELIFSFNHQVLKVIIHDNGKGFPKDEFNSFGNGLKNIKNRMNTINGNFEIVNLNGTKISLLLPVLTTL